MTMVAGIARRAAWYATAWAWLPADIAMTPRARAKGSSEASLLSAPRSLNELVTCRFSYLTWTSAPVSAESFGAGSIGVRSTAPASVRRAASTSAMVTPRSPANGRASCAKTVYSRVCPPAWRSIARIREDIGHDRQRTAADRRVDRAQAPRLRPRRQPGAVRGGAGAPPHRLPDPPRKHRHSGAARRHVHPDLRPVHVRARLAALRAPLAGVGHLGDRLLRHDPGEPGFRHHRHAGAGRRDAHLVRGARIFRARRGARDRVLGDYLVPHPADPAGRLLQRAPAAPARHAGRHRRRQQSARRARERKGGFCRAPAGARS